MAKKIVKAHYRRTKKGRAKVRKHLRKSKPKNKRSPRSRYVSGLLEVKNVPLRFGDMSEAKATLYGDKGGDLWAGELEIDGQLYKFGNIRESMPRKMYPFVALRKTPFTDLPKAPPDKTRRLTKRHTQVFKYSPKENVHILAEDRIRKR